ncbi:MAG: superoxide dismutase [Acidobacteria bacterium]|nr:superoxide dismutase [Acidobacteriota bacterium]
MKNITRREALTGIIGAGVAGIAASGTTFSQPTAAQAVPPAFAGKHAPMPLPFNPAKLNGISEKLITSHHDNNYAGAVKALNLVENHLAALMNDKDMPAYLYGELKREELIRTGSVVMHEKYFANLGGDGKASGTAQKLIAQNWGSFEAWDAEFRRIANALSGGSGWTVLAYNNHTKEMHNYWMADHSTSPAFTTPILVLDMYEHAYQMDYGAAAAKYIDAFMTNVNWDEVNKRVEGWKM